MCSSDLLAFSSTNIYKFFQQNTGNVEVQKDNDIMTIYFPIQPVTRFLTATTQALFTRTVTRESNQHKITDLIARTPEFVDEMDTSLTDADDMAHQLVNAWMGEGKNDYPALETPAGYTGTPNRAPGQRVKW